MTRPNERSTLRLATGFIAGASVFFAGIAFVPKPEFENTESSEVVGLTDQTSEPVAQETEPTGQAPQTVTLEAPKSPQDANPGSAIETELAAVAPEPAIVTKTETPALSPATEAKSIDLVQSQTELAARMLVPEIENSSVSLPQPEDAPFRTINVVKRIDTLEIASDVQFASVDLPPPPPPQRDTIAQSLQTTAPSIAFGRLDEKTAPQAPEPIAQEQPELAALDRPADPEIADLSVKSPVEVRVSVNSFGKKPSVNDSGTRGLLAAVTGADRPPRPALTGGLGTEDAPDANAESGKTAPPTPPIATGPAFESFAAAYQDAGDKPLLAVILIDPGDEGMDRNFLKNLSFPVTFAIPADGDRAQFFAAEYRDKGFEIVAMVPGVGPEHLHRRSRPQEVAGLVSEYTRRVPGSIGLADYPDGDLHQNSRLMQALTSALSQTGHAVLTNKKRINNSDRIAQEVGVPFAKMLRPIDADGSVPSIRRALERAALTASKAGGAFIIGHSEPQTIKTLYEWLLSNSARSVDVAPVSAVIKRLGQG